MPVFFVHDVNHGIVKPLDRKFKVREISPVQEATKSQAIHSKEASDLPNFQTVYLNTNQDSDEQPAKQTPSPELTHKAIQSYQENIPPPPKFNLGKVKDIMNQPVIKIFQDQTLESAWNVMQEHDIHHLIVLNADNQYCGLLSEKQIIPYLMNYAKNKQGKLGPSELPLSHFCGQNLLSTHPETELHDLGVALMEYGLDAIAVSDNTKIIGIITKSDIFKVILKLQNFEELA